MFSVELPPDSLNLKTVPLTLPFELGSPPSCVVLVKIAGRVENQSGIGKSSVDATRR